MRHQTVVMWNYPCKVVPTQSINKNPIKINKPKPDIIISEGLPQQNEWWWNTWQTLFNARSIQICSVMEVLAWHWKCNILLILSKLPLQCLYYAEIPFTGQCECLSTPHRKYIYYAPFHFSGSVEWKPGFVWLSTMGLNIAILKKFSCFCNQSDRIVNRL